jgi:hypothetical protein
MERPQDPHQTRDGRVEGVSKEPFTSNGVSGKPTLRVVRQDERDQEVYEDRLDEPLEMPQQVLELASHLKKCRESLVEREERLTKEVDAWRISLESQQAANSDQAIRLRNRELQLRSLQFHLLQLQNDVVDSQLAMESVIEHFENVDSDEYLKSALELLRFEVLDRFDYISKRWEMLHDKIEGMYGRPELKKCA